jgi:predicted house-cleaning noncanonical NTP pyrophosphatase (MazG superfamily)
VLPELKKLLKQCKLPDSIIEELEHRPLEYQKDFLDAIQGIMQNEVVSLHAFMEVREAIVKKGFEKRRAN